MIPLAALAIVAVLFAYREHSHARDGRSHADERSKLVNALIARTPSEYAVMQRADHPTEKPEPEKQRNGVYPIGSS